MGAKAGKRFRGFREDPARAELLALYHEADQLLASFACETSTDCCHFGRTGREPYPTAVEVAETGSMKVGKPVIAPAISAATTMAAKVFNMALTPRHPSFLYVCRRIYA
jgi:hypothetical protein